MWLNLYILTNMPSGVFKNMNEALEEHATTTLTIHTLH